MPYPCYSSGPLLFYGIGVVRASVQGAPTIIYLCMIYIAGGGRGGQGRWLVSGHIIPPEFSAAPFRIVGQFHNI